MNITNALEIAINHLDCLTAGQHPFIAEGRSALLNYERDSIEAELNRPEPELVAWRALNFAEHGGVYAYRDHDEPFVGVSGSNVGEPLYTTPPDQSARIAELELALARANADIESVEDRLIVKNQRLYECNEKLATLQAKREPLSDDEIQDIHNELPSRSTYYEFARAIEAAHNIGVNHE